MIGFYIALFMAIILASLFIFFWKKETPIIDFFLKGLATISVIALCLTVSLAKGFTTSSMLLLLGLALCMLGDLVLALREIDFKNNDKIITLGEISFGLAQLVFIIWLAIETNLWSLLGLVFGIIFGAGMLVLRKPMKLDFRNTLIPTLAYSFLLATNVAGSFIWLIVSSASIASCIAFAGFVLFILSDLILSKIYFGGNEKIVTQKVNYIFYYLAIILVAITYIAL